MGEFHKMDKQFSTIQGDMGTVKRRRSVQALSKPPSYDNSLAKPAFGRNDSEQSIPHSTELPPSDEDSPRAVPSPPGIVESVGHSVSQKPAAGSILDKLLSVASPAVKHLIRMAKVQSTPLLVDLLSQLCSISGIVLQLKLLSQDGTHVDQPSVTMATLGSPSGLLPDLVLRLEELPRRLDRWRSEIWQTEGPEPQTWDIYLTEIRSSFDEHMENLLYALQNEPGAWPQAMELISTTVCDEMENPGGDNCSPKSRRHTVQRLTSIEDEHEQFLHWLVGDHIPSKSSISALIASPETGDRLLQSKDASLCVQEYLDYSPKWKRLDDEDKRNIEGWLLDEAHGDLLWVTLCFKLLEDCPHLNDARTFIQNIPKTMPGVYDRLLSSIPGARKLEARQALQWMAVSERPLYLEEVAEAAMLELPGSSCPTVRLSTSFEIAKICAGLVTLIPALGHEPYRKKVTFVHHTLKEYLLSDDIGSPAAAFFAISELEAQKLISYVSLGYLLSAIEDAPLSIMERANFPLLEYVLKNWYKHIKAVQKVVPVPQPTLDRAVKLLDARYARRENSEHDKAGSKGPEGPEALYLEGCNFPPPLYYASRLGLVDVVQKLLLRGDQHQDSGAYLGTPLQAAAFGGHWPVIKELVDKGADVNAVSGFDGTALQAASYSGQYDASGVLLDCGANVNSISGHYGTPLQAAAYGGHAELIFLLTLYRAKVNTNNGFYGSPLIAAVQGGHEEVVVMLIKSGAKVNTDGNIDFPNALYGASAKGHRTMVAKLLNYQADPNKDGKFGISALEVAIEGGHSDVVQLLLQNTTTLNRMSSTGLDLGGLALHMAAQGGHKDLMQQLLQRLDVNVNNVDYQDKDGLSPLLIAVLRGHEAIVHLLLEEGVDTSLTDKDGLTALMGAVIEGHQGLVVLLLEHGAGVKARDNYGRTPLMLAVEEGHEAIAFLLLQHGAIIEAPDHSGRIPMDVAVSKGYQTIKKLLDFGVSGTAVADRDRFWRTFSRMPMHLHEQDRTVIELEATSKTVTQT